MEIKLYISPNLWEDISGNITQHIIFMTIIPTIMKLTWHPRDVFIGV